MKSLYQETDFSGVNKFYLLMGTACNMKCRHCIQTPLKDDFNFVFKENDKVFQLSERFIQYCVSMYDRKRPVFFNFWGGEPLLYWDFIKKQVIEWTEKYDVLKNNNLRFKITTNGLLLNNEIVDFINKYQIKVFFSYDAPYPFAVRDYVSDEVCDLVRKINGYEIECNYSAYNCDPLLAYRCSKAKFPEAKVQANWRLIRSFDMSPDIYNFDKEKVKNSIRKARIAYQLNDPFMQKYIENRFVLPLSLKKDNTLPMFGSENMICVDMNGNIRIGFNSDIIAGTVDGSLNNLFIASHKIRRGMLSDDCIVCRDKDICRVCLYDNKKNGHFVSCKDYYLFFYDTVREEMKKTNYDLSEEDLLWYKEQEVLMEKIITCYLNEGRRFKDEKTRLPENMYF